MDEEFNIFDDLFENYHRSSQYDSRFSQYTNYRMTMKARVKILIEDDGAKGQGRAFTVEIPHEVLKQLWDGSLERTQERLQDPPYLDVYGWYRDATSTDRARQRAEEERARHSARVREQERLLWEAFRDSAQETADAFRGFTFTSTNAKQSGKGQPSLRSQVAMLVTDGDTTELLKLPDGRLYMRAKRSCHPDTGGSHDKWLKLQDLAKQLGW